MEEKVVRHRRRRERQEPCWKRRSYDGVSWGSRRELKPKIEGRKKDSLEFVAPVTLHFLAIDNHDSLVPRDGLLPTLSSPTRNSQHHRLKFLQSCSTGRLNGEHLDENVDGVEGEGSEVEEERARIAAEAKEGVTSEGFLPPVESKEEVDRDRVRHREGKEEKRRRRTRDGTRNSRQVFRSADHHQEHHPQPPNIVSMSIVGCDAGGDFVSHSGLMKGRVPRPNSFDSASLVDNPQSANRASHVLSPVSSFQRSRSRMLPGLISL